MHLRKRIVSAIGLCALGLAGSAVVSAGVSAAPDSAGNVYVNDNTAGTNTIAAFERHGNGTLTRLEGSPFNAGGAGTGTIIGSQGALQVSSDGRYLLAVDAGSNQISVLRIRPDGSLQAVENGTVASGGIQPVSIAVNGRLVYVANEGTAQTAPNYTGFTLNRDGHLTPIDDSTVTLPIDANPGDILFNSTGTNLIGIEVGIDRRTSVIDSFVVGKHGRLTRASGSPFAAQAEGPFGSEFSPANPGHLYVSNAHGGGGNGSVSAFSVAHNGTLSSIGASPYADHQTAPCWVEISHDGRYLFTVNTGSTTISSYQVLADGSLSLLGPATTFSSGSKGVRPFDARLDPAGQNLYVVDAGIHKVSAFGVSGGTLTELSQSPAELPTDATPFGIVVTHGQENEN
jgi:6-phosphogluconolactonase